MKVGVGRAAAAGWVAEHAAGGAGFRGAYVSGSTVGMAADAELPAASDIDVVVVTAEDEPPVKPGKFRYRGALLEVSYVPWAQLASAEEVLGAYHLAGAFRTDTVLDDPTGRLRVLQARVAREFAARPWVRRRCEDARRRVETRLAAIDPAAPLHEQVTGWLFPTGVTCHVLLAAALRNPTVRLRYPAAREVLSDYGQLALYPGLLDLLGCRDLTAQRVQHQLDALTATFDATAEVARTPYFFRSDISADARPIAIDGSQALIDRGEHREAVFWIVATFARCHSLLAADAPDLHGALAPAFRTVLADLGIGSAADIRPRAEATLRFLPRVWQAAEHIMAANPDIRG